MRAAFFAFTVWISVIQLTAQQASTVSPVCTCWKGMKSSTWTERSKAFDQASGALARNRLARDGSR